ncbi:hypothetical protein OWV82_015551 [Melia azedarach]|uniref:Uncharacterized protein n=2 Tax=Melia azedarach TaxID=155640 RepID=A0ACC1XQ29_MELAZ|nr:hypothetical protein OWV82_015551 [Melia azedarach]KAJ4713459.1 hypothetical protein OWV82_015551 [Melia azedarach]
MMRTLLSTVTALISRQFTFPSSSFSFIFNIKLMIWMCFIPSLLTVIAFIDVFFVFLLEMEADTGTPLCVSFNKYCSHRRRRRYRRLKGTMVIGDDKEIKVTSTRKRFRTIGTIPKRFRDAYEEMMLSFARNVSQLNDGNNICLLLKKGTPEQHL